MITPQGRPAGNAEYGIVVATVTGPDRETQVEADQQQETHPPPFHDLAAASRDTELVLPAVGEEMTLIIMFLGTVGFDEVETVIYALPFPDRGGEYRAGI